MDSKLCDLFGIKHPIIQGGMQWLATAEFAAAVSNTGALGTINSSLCRSKQELVDMIHRTRQLTKNPFAVNISMLPNQPAGELTLDFLAAVAEEKVAVVELSGTDPTPYVPALKQAGVRVIHKSPAVRFAKKAVAAGVDAVTIVGFECAGHPGMDDVTTLTLIPAVVDAVDVPVIAGGGVCDSRSYAAVRCLGAQGAVIGTRFMATRECPVHENFKQLMLTATERDTAIVQRSIKNAARYYKNSAIKRLIEMETTGKPTLQEILAIVSGAHQRECYESGDLETGPIPLGQCVGQIHEILSVQEVVDEMVSGSNALLR